MRCCQHLSLYSHADMEYAVEPLGVATMSPSASAAVTKLPSMWISRCTEEGKAPLTTRGQTTCCTHMYMQMIDLRAVGVQQASTLADGEPVTYA